MDNNPIALMMAEHEVISSVKKLLPFLKEYSAENPTKYKTHIRSLITFFREYSDQFHHHKEEELLFPKLSKHVEFSQQGILDELEEHHEMFREHTKAMEEELDKENYAKVQSILETYMNQLLDHIAAENEELFIMAESLFSEDELETLYFQFQDIDEELGTDRKEELVEMIEAIESDLGIK